MKKNCLTVLCIGLVFLSSCAASGPSMEPATETALPETPTEVPPTAIPPLPSPEPTHKITYFPNQAYVPGGRKEQKLDLYMPETGEGPFPTILAFHGGAFQKGPEYPNKTTYLPKFGRYFSNLGYAFISAGYRLAPDYTYPAQVEDVFCALAWIHANHETYGLDPDNVIIMGDSAGGYLAAMLSTVETPELYLEDCPNKLPDSDWIQGTVVFYGFFDITDVSDLSGKGSRLEPYLGMPWNEVPLERLEEMSPMSWVDGSEAPFLLIQGTRDSILPISISTNFAEVLEDAGVQVEVLLVEAEHGYMGEPITSPANEISLKAIEAFLKMVIGK